MASKDNYMIVAFDFGTTYSGYAFQLTSDYQESDPTKGILCPQSWNNGQTQLISLKTPTCLLLDQNGDIDSFGFEAENKYAGLCMDGDNKQWYYFRRFKMELHDRKGLTKETRLTDETGRELPALTVFSRSIECLKKHLEELLTGKNIYLSKVKVKWVLTVPAIWDDTAKAFMRQAAVQAGIPSDRLFIALEPEAASLYCQYLPVEKMCVGGEVKFGDAQPGTTYMIVDLGGGTADITLHEKLANHKLKEVHRASGGPWGGTAVDGAFINLLSSIMGGPVFARFKREQTYDYLDLMREFEAVKRNVGVSTKDDVKMKLPATMNETCKNVVGKDFKTLVKVAKKDKLITFMGDKMKISANLIKDLFKKVTDKILGHVRSILKDTQAGRNAKLILMVGGFSESPYVQDVIRGEFDGKNGRKVVIPRDAGISVLNGAVVFGRQPGNITSRILRYTYGVRVTPDFDGKKHKASKKTTEAGVSRCNDVFSKFIDIGTEVQCGHTVQSSYSTTRPFQSGMDLQVFASTELNPAYTDDNESLPLGLLVVDVPQPSADEHSMTVIYEFGDTELKISALEQDSNTPCCATMRMLE